MAIYLDGTINGVKIYRALFYQEMTEEPEPVVLENTIGTIVWTRYGEGEFRGTLSGAFPQDKTFLITGSEYDLNNTDAVLQYFKRLNDDVVYLWILDAGPQNPIDGENTDNYLSVEIRVYP